MLADLGYTVRFKHMRVSNGWNELFPYLLHTLHVVECATRYDIIGDKFIGPYVQVVYYIFHNKSKLNKLLKYKLVYKYPCGMYYASLYSAVCNTHLFLSHLTRFCHVYY